MLRSAGPSPAHADVSLMATTYIVWSTDSIVKRQKTKRIAYESFSFQVISSGRLS
jgi:hypothetical protein